MKTLTSAKLSFLALSLASCASVASRSINGQGRIIEFKSGPEGFDTKSYFYEGANEVIAIDSQFTPALAQKSIEHLRNFTQKPITWLVITHPNPDKFNGASEFKKLGAKIISSEATAKAIPAVHAYKEYFFVKVAQMFKAGEYPQPVSVDETFNKNTELVLQGGEKLELFELSGPGVSSNQSVLYIPSKETLIVGDLVHHKAHAWLEGGIQNSKATPTIDSWQLDLAEIEKRFPANTQVLGGRGQAGLLSEVIPAQRTYLQKASEIVDHFIAKLGTRASELQGPNAQALYQNLTADFQKAFPDYDLGYMIQYGAYGLVNQKLESRKEP